MQSDPQRSAFLNGWNHVFRDHHLSRPEFNRNHAVCIGRLNRPDRQRRKILRFRDTDQRPQFTINQHIDQPLGSRFPRKACRSISTATGRSADASVISVIVCDAPTPQVPHGSGADHPSVRMLDSAPLAA